MPKKRAEQGADTSVGGSNLEQVPAAVPHDTGGDSDASRPRARGRRSGPESGGSVYDVRLSDAAFRVGVKAIYVQSLQMGSVQTIRRASVLGLKIILGLDRSGILDLLADCEPGWHEGRKKFFIQLSPPETDLVRDVRRAIGWVDPDRAPKTVGETLALGLLAGSDEAQVIAHLAQATKPDKRRRNQLP